LLDSATFDDSMKFMSANQKLF